MSESKVGLAVICRRRIRPGAEQEFQQTWEAAKKSFLSEHDALGSALHRAEDGTWIAYAQSPCEAAWQRSRELGPTNDGPAATMHAAAEETFAPILMQPVCDYLVRE